MENLQLRYPKAYLSKNISVYIGIIAYLAMVATGDVVVGAWGKLLAEVLRVPYYRVTQAKDMERLSYFFIVVSSAVIIPSLLQLLR